MSAQNTAIAALFTPVSMNAEQYDEVIRRLEATGWGAPPGRLFHICFGSGDQLRVLDLYDSPESMQSFGQALMPILGQLGIELAAPPDVSPLYNTIDGRTSATA